MMQFSKQWRSKNFEKEGCRERLSETKWSMSRDPKLLEFYIQTDSFLGIFFAKFLSKNAMKMRLVTANCWVTTEQLHGSAHVLRK